MAYPKPGEINPDEMVEVKIGCKDDKVFGPSTGKLVDVTDDAPIPGEKDVVGVEKQAQLTGRDLGKSELIAHAMENCYRSGQAVGQARNLRRMGDGSYDVPGSVVISKYLIQFGLVKRWHFDWLTLQIALDAHGLEVISNVEDLEPGMLVVLTNRRETHGPDGMGIVAKNQHHAPELVACYCGDARFPTLLNLVKGRPCMDYALKIGNRESGIGISGEGIIEHHLPGQGEKGQFVVGTIKPNRISGKGPEDMSDIDKLHTLIDGNFGKMNQIAEKISGIFEEQEKWLDKLTELQKMTATHLDEVGAAVEKRLDGLEAELKTDFETSELPIGVRVDAYHGILDVSVDRLDTLEKGLEQVTRVVSGTGLPEVQAKAKGPYVEREKPKPKSAAKPNPKGKHKK